jgi:hypothetical protein
MSRDKFSAAGFPCTVSKASLCLSEQGAESLLCQRETLRSAWSDTDRGNVPKLEGKLGADSAQDSPSRPAHVVWIVVLITLLAFFLRTYRLHDIPPGFNYDEAAHAMDSLEVLQGTHVVFSPRSGGNPMLFMYLIAGFFGLMGPHPFTQRLLVVFMSTATVPAIYLLALTMFHKLGKRRAQFIGILAALGLATSFWHLNHSRMGLEFNLAPFFEVLSFYFLWRGFIARRWWHFVVSGFWLGLALYVYPTARFVPVLLILFFVYLWLLGDQPERGKTRGDFFKRVFLPLVLIGVSVLVVFSPVGIHFLLHPSDFFGRAGDTVFLNPVVSQGQPWSRLLRGTIANVGAFGITTDENALANVPGRSLLDPAMAVLFWAGLLWSVYRLKNPPHAFCVLWWAVLLVPVILTPDRFPHFGRLISVAPVAYIFIALTLDQGWHKLGQLTRSRRSSPGPQGGTWGDRPTLRQAARLVLIVGMVLIYGTAGVSAYQDYFFKWATSEDTYEDFYGPTVELANLMNVDAAPDAVYVLPCGTRPPACDYYTLDFCHREGVPYHAIRMNEWEVPEKLTQVTQGKDLVKLIHLKIGKRKFLLEEADPKGVLDFLLERYGYVERIESFPAYDIIHYRLPSRETDFSTPVDSRTMDAGFGGRMLLQDAVFGDASGPALSEERIIPAGGTLWALLRWRSLGEITERYKTSLRLRDLSGHLVAQLDHTLQDNWQNRTTRWKPGDERVPDYYLFPVPNTTPPGDYTLEIVVYPPDSVRPLPVDGESGTSTVTLGTVRVIPPEVISDTFNVSMTHEMDEAVSPEISIAGYDLDTSRPYAPGEKSSLAIYWQVRDRIEQDLRWYLELEAPEQNWPLVELARPLGPQFPTTNWVTGQTWKGIYDITIPARIPEGPYSVIGYLTDERGQPYGEPIRLGEMDVAGRARNFEMPEMGHPVEADFDGKIRLLGYELNQPTTLSGSDLEIILHWQALAQMDIGYTIFVHLLDGDGLLRAQRDIVPGDGSLPTTGWLPGEIVADRITIPIAEDLSAGPYVLVVGVYDASIGQRLSAYDQSDQFLGDHLVLHNLAVE